MEYKLICLYVNTPGCSASRGVPKLRKEELSKVMNNYPPSFLWSPRVLGFLEFRYSSNMLPWRLIFKIMPTSLFLLCEYLSKIKIRCRPQYFHFQMKPIVFYTTIIRHPLVWLYIVEPSLIFLKITGETRFISLLKQQQIVDYFNR